MRNGNEKKQESDKYSYLAVVLLLRVKDPVSLICHCRAVKSAGRVNKCGNTTASIASFLVRLGSFISF